MKLKIQYKSRNVELSEAMKEYFSKKMAKLERLIKDEDSDVEARFSKERQFYTVEITFKMRSIIVRAEEKNKDFYASVDVAVDNLERRLKRFKDRFRTLRRERAAEEANVITGEDATKENEEKVVKIKKFELRPMSVEEAMIQLEMLDHEFFMFRNAENDQINVIYRRRDGNYGLITPE